MTEPDDFCGKSAYEKLINKGFDVVLHPMLEPNCVITRKPHLVAALDKMKESGKFPEFFSSPREPEQPQ